MAKSNEKLNIENIINEIDKIDTSEIKNYREAALERFMSGKSVKETPGRETFKKYVDLNRQLIEATLED